MMHVFTSAPALLHTLAAQHRPHGLDASAQTPAPVTLLSHASPTNSVVLWALLAVVAAAALAFRAMQMRGKLGGKIATSKTIWLGLVVALWFAVVPVVAFDQAIAFGLRLVLGVFFANMALRGGIELFMLYVSKNWKPRYGMAHALFSIALIVLSALVVQFGLGEPVFMGLAQDLDRWALMLIMLVVMSLGTEWLHAFTFSEVVNSSGQTTTGDHAVWFAHKDDPRFQQILKNTVRYNLFFLAATAAFVARYQGLL